MQMNIIKNSLKLLINSNRRYKQLIVTNCSLTTTVVLGNYKNMQERYNETCLWLLLFINFQSLIVTVAQIVAHSGLSHS